MGSMSTSCAHGVGRCAPHRRRRPDDGLGVSAACGWSREEESAAQAGTRAPPLHLFGTTAEKALFQALEVALSKRVGSWIGVGGGGGRAQGLPQPRAL